MPLNKPKYLPLLMWLFPLIFFTYQFILRLWPGLMMNEIMAQFSIDASSFGVLAAFYYYGYAGMQIPIAVLLDRFGPRSIIFLFASICGLATVLFTYSDNFYLALISRFLIGAGSAVGFLGVSKVVSQWFKKEHYARMIGFTFTIGLMGAIYGGRPLSLLLESHNWQNIALVLALISILIGCGTLLILRSPKIETETRDTAIKFGDFVTLLSSRTIWLLALSNLLMVGSLEGFADVWGVSYLVTAFDINKAEAAGIISFIFFGMLFGGPLLAYASKKMGNYPIIALSGIGMTFAFVLLFMSTTYSWWLLSSLCFIVGILCCYQVIVFAAGSDLVPSQYLGVTVAFLNCVNMLGGSFFHTIIGAVMDLYWTGAMGEDGLKFYNLEVYKYALSVIPICALIGAIMTCFVGFNVKRQQTKVGYLAARS